MNNKVISPFAVLIFYICTMAMGRNWCVQVVLYVLYHGIVHGSVYSNLMYKQSIEYIEDDILENITATSALQCARRCSFLNECAAIEFLGDNSTCVVVKSATKMNETTNKEQYTKTVCDEGWVKFSVSCYLMSPDAHNWTECEGICAANGGYLATETSHLETAFIKDLRKGKGIWLGGRRLSNETGFKTWKWINGEKWEYTNWSPEKEKNYEHGDCLTYYGPATKWNAYLCTKKRKCMCEKRST